MNTRDYQRIEQAIDYIAGNYQRQPSLEEIAAKVSLSPFHFNRLFKQWAGITPKQFLMFVTLQAAKGNLNGRSSVLDAAIASGLSGPGRLHDLFVTVEAVTPGEYKTGGKDLCIQHGVTDSPFGRCSIAQTDRGICHLAFGADAINQNNLQAELEKRWPSAELRKDEQATTDAARRIFYQAAQDGRRDLRLLVKGTNFQLKVWRALLSLEAGETTTYSSIAKQIGQPSAMRAVGNAVGRNAIAFLIPCHRVLRANGSLGGYRWGTKRKLAMLAWEAARTAKAS